MNNKSRYSILHILIICIIIVTIVYALLKGSNKFLTISGIKENNFQESKLLLSYSADTMPSFYTNGSEEFYFVNREGVKYIDATGRIIFEYNFQMENPKVVYREDILSVVDYGSNTVYTFNKSGLMYNKQFDSKIINISVNKNGYVSVILLFKDEYKISVVENTGQTIVWEATIADKNLFPNSVAVSDNNKIISYSTIDIDNIVIKSDIVFSYIEDRNDPNFDNSIIGSVKIGENEIIGYMEYRGANLYAVSDAGVYSYNINSGGGINAIETISMEKDIVFSEVSNKASIALTLGAINKNKQTDSENTVIFYNKNGKKTGTVKLQDSITYLNYDLDVAIIGTNRNFVGVKPNGSKVWQYTASRDVKQIKYINNNKLILAGTTEAYILSKK